MWAPSQARAAPRRYAHPPVSLLATTIGCCIHRHCVTGPVAAADDSRTAPAAHAEPTPGSSRRCTARGGRRGRRACGEKSLRRDRDIWLPRLSRAQPPRARHPRAVFPSMVALSSNLTTMTVERAAARQPADSGRPSLAHADLVQEDSVQPDAGHPGSEQRARDRPRRYGWTPDRSRRYSQTRHESRRYRPTRRGSPGTVRPSVAPLLERNRRLLAGYPTWRMDLRPRVDLRDPAQDEPRREVPGLMPATGVAGESAGYGISWLKKPVQQKRGRRLPGS